MTDTGHSTETGDPVMDRITEAVTASRAGDVTGPRATMVALWDEITGRLGSFDAARDHLATARGRLNALPDDDYRHFIATLLDEIADAVDQQSTQRRSSAPGPAD